jgi:hypothetical protein
MYPHPKNCQKMEPKSILSGQIYSTTRCEYDIRKICKNNWEIGSLTYVFRNRGWWDSTASWPIHKQHYKHHFSLTAQFIFHKLTIIPSINPTSSSTFPNKPLLSRLSIPEQHKNNPCSSTAEHVYPQPHLNSQIGVFFLLFTNSTF